MERIDLTTPYALGEVDLNSLLLSSPDKPDIINPIFQTRNPSIADRHVLEALRDCLIGNRCRLRPAGGTVRDTLLYRNKDIEDVNEIGLPNQLPLLMWLSRQPLLESQLISPLRERAENILSHILMEPGNGDWKISHSEEGVISHLTKPTIISHYITGCLNKNGISFSQTDFDEDHIIIHLENNSSTVSYPFLHAMIQDSSSNERITTWVTLIANSAFSRGYYICRESPTANPNLKVLTIRGFYESENGAVSPSGLRIRISPYPVTVEEHQKDRRAGCNVNNFQQQFINPCSMFPTVIDPETGKHTSKFVEDFLPKGFPFNDGDRVDATLGRMLFNAAIFARVQPNSGHPSDYLNQITPRTMKDIVALVDAALPSTASVRDETIARLFSCFSMGPHAFAKLARKINLQLRFPRIGMLIDIIEQHFPDDEKYIKGYESPLIERDIKTGELRYSKDKNPVAVLDLAKILNHRDSSPIELFAWFLAYKDEVSETIC